MGIARSWGVCVGLVFGVGCTNIGDTPDPIAIDAGVIDPIVDADPGPDAAPEPVSLTQNTDPDTVTAANSVACVNQDANGVPIFHQENSYYRVFDLEAMGVTRSFAIDNVRFGVESANPGAANQQLVEVKLYTLADGADFKLANLTEIGAGSALVADVAQELIDVPITATAPAGSTLVVEVLTPNGDPDRLLFIGSNTAGQDGASFLRAPSCDDDADPNTPSAFEEPVDLTPFFPDMHVVIVVSGEA